MAEVPAGEAPMAAELSFKVETFNQKNPYIRSESRGVLFVPPEAEENYEEAKLSENAAKMDGLQALSVKPRASGLQTLEDFLDEADNISDGLPQTTRNYTVVWEATVVSDDWSEPGHCDQWGDLKPRRPVPHIRVSRLLSGLAWGHSGNHFYADALNEWPAMQNFMLVSLKGAKAGAKAAGRSIWTAKSRAALPSAQDLQDAFGAAKTGVATFLGPSWSTMGWTPDSAGFVYWFSEQHGEPRMLCGEKMIQQMQEDDPKLRNSHVSNISHYVHRYPVEKSKETQRDRNEWHCFLLLEWEHGRFMTVVESAWMNGIGGFGGKTNWCEDKLEAEPKAYRAMPPGMVRPWDSRKSEYRCWDVPAKTVAEFEQYLHKYSEKGALPQKEQRFLLPQKYASAPRKIRSLKAVDVASYLLNYAERMPSYNVPYSNCMTFATDFYAFTTGARDFPPYSPGLRPYYQQHILAFVYEASS